MSGPSSALVGMGAGMISRRLVVRAKDVVFVKGVIEAHDGLAHVFAESGGDLTIAAAVGREAELDELVADLAAELGGIVGEMTDG
ncbi:MAG: hypothetical protein K0S65_1690 [Labilithrix sp.]|nr:hypothetical protein [Labilithrix sp.]